MALIAVNPMTLLRCNPTMALLVVNSKMLLPPWPRVVAAVRCIEASVGVVVVASLHPPSPSRLRQTTCRRRRVLSLMSLHRSIRQRGCLLSLLHRCIRHRRRTLGRNILRRRCCHGARQATLLPWSIAGAAGAAMKRRGIGKSSVGLQ